MLNLNKFTATGRLTKDVELRYTAKGKPVIGNTIAIANPYKDADGKWQDNPCFLDFTVWDKQAEYVNNYMKKGEAAYIEGRLEQQEYEKDGKTIKKIVLQVFDIKALEYKKKDDTPAESQPEKPTVTNDDTPF